MKIMNMTKKLMYAVLVLSMAFSSCKKDKTEDNNSNAVLTDSQLENVSDGGMTISTQLQSFMAQTLSEALLSGDTIVSPPEIPAKKSTKFSLLKNVKDNDWMRLDSGWYMRRYTSLGYTITEEVKFKDSTATYRMTTEYEGSEGSYSSVYETQYTKYTLNHKVLYKGYTDISYNSDGYNDISSVDWKFIFTDWNPLTGAGTYDWFWSARSLGGDFVPYHRFLNIIATEVPFSDPAALHVKITWYGDDGTEYGPWEFDTTWTPVEMPPFPSLN
jgi:hypothetical protein